MKKTLLIVLFCAFGATCFSQTATDTLKAEILTAAADALKAGNTPEYVLWYVVIEHFMDADFEGYYKTTFPIALQMHIDNKSWCADAAKKIKVQLSTKRI